MRFMPASDSALLVELDNLGQAMALYRHLRQHPIHGVSELVPAARTVLVQYRPSAITPTELLTALRERGAAAEERQNDLAEPGRLVEIPVHYNGEDLPEVAERSEEHTSELQSRENLVCRLL